MSSPGKLNTLAITKYKYQKGRCSVEDCIDSVTGRTLVCCLCSSWTEMTLLIGIHQFCAKTLPNTVLYLRV